MAQVTHFMYGTSSTYRADAFTSASATNVKEGQITAAIAAAVSDGVQAVFVPQSMLPYNASLVTFNSAVKMLREGGPAFAHDPQAYGAAGNAVITVRATGAGTKATITGQDDTVALQRCINDAAANLEVVLLPPNAFKITAMLLLPTNTQIMGQGWNSQICPDWFDAIGAASGGVAYFANTNWQNGNGDSNITLRNFYLNGACPGTPSASSLPNGIATGIFLRGGAGAAVSDVAIQNNKITNIPGIAVAFQGALRVQVTNNLIRDTGKDGIHGCWHTARLQDIIVEGNTIYTPGDDGIAMLCSETDGVDNTDQRPTRIAIVGNTIRDITTNGVGRAIIIIGCDDTTITGNVIQNTFSVGIALQADSVGSLFSCRRISVTGNVIQDAGQAGNGTQPQHAIRCQGSQNVTIVGNSIDACKTSAIKVDDNGGVAACAVSDITVADNIITNSGTADTDFGIYISGLLAGGAKRIAVRGNQVYLNAGGGIAQQGASEVTIADNTVTDCGGATSGATDNFASGIVCIGSGLTPTVYVRGNRCTDTRGGSAKQSYGVCLASSTGGLGVFVLENNFLENNRSGAFQNNQAPTTLIRRNNRLSTGQVSGIAVLVGGTVTVNTAEIFAADTIALTRVVAGGTARGHLTVGAIVAGTSFVITSQTLAAATETNDTSTVFWEIVH